MRAITAAALAAIAVIAALPSWAADASRAKPSSYAPQPHSSRRVYGAPIQPPILGHRKSANHKQSKSQAGSRAPQKPKAKSSKPAQSTRN